MSKTALYPTVEEINSAFSEQVEDAGGSISERFHGEDSLYLRAILDLSQEVFPRDTINSGIALRVIGPSVSIHPYTFREVCQNGAISSKSEWSLNITRPEVEFESQQFLGEIRGTISALVDGEPFSECLLEMRQAHEVRLDLLSIVMKAVAPFGLSPESIDDVLNQFFGSEPQTGFGLMNAITAVARKQPKPEVKWKLQEVGGGIPARLRELPECDHVKEAKQIPQPVA